ncbi:MAG: single-stranded DNA-binding protein [bacterium]|nr:single-stranded DNA-binding protein [bacterium]
MVNRVILIGRLVRDPELRSVASGQAMARFTMAVDRGFANADGHREADFIDIVVWRMLAEQVAEHLRRGRLVGIEGRLQIRRYETAQGKRRKAVEVVADRVRFLDRKPREERGDQVFTEEVEHGVPV